jgi:hypothetical protein
MKVGSKSLLFGVHQALWHPITVARAWRFLYGRWPNRYEWICIFCHDLGYWGKPNMDGEEGQTHPEAGALLAGRLCYQLAKLSQGREYAERNKMEFVKLCLFHSRYYAKRAEQPVSDLFLPDKLSVLFEPRWFYVLRASLSGEIREYMANAGDRVPAGTTRWGWHRWYQGKVVKLLKEYL